MIARNTNLLRAHPQPVELTYLQSAADLAQMIAAGTFPFPGEQVNMDASPRAGDGLLRLGRTASSPTPAPTRSPPSTASAWPPTWSGCTSAGPPPSWPRRPARPGGRGAGQAGGGWAPRQIEVESADGVVQLRAIPLKPKGVHTGALVLLRDVTELRRRERELMTKDATIREIHHRVKNNLQTVAALLRLQSRRMGSEAAKAALDEAVRRVGSIAIVHETCRRAGGVVAFDEIADRVANAARELSAPRSGVVLKLAGSFGLLRVRLGRDAAGHASTRTAGQ